MEKRPLLLVEFDDYSGNSKWRSMDEDYTDIIARLKTVGWKLKSSRKVLVLASTIFEREGDCDDRQIIPRGSIRSIRRLE